MANALFGTNTEKCVLWLDLWGMSKTLEDHAQSKGDLTVQADIAHKLSIFVSTLAVITQSMTPRLEVAQGSDGAFIIGDKPDDVLEAALRVFRNISFIRDNFFFIPVRGGISKNLIEVESNRAQLSQISGFSYLPYLGEGFAKAFKMEAAGRKGMRLFITDSVKSTLGSRFQKFVSSNEEPRKVSILNEPAEPYFEVNWMEPAYLALPEKSRSVEDCYTALTAVWNGGDRFQKEMAESLDELIAWTKSGVQTKTW